MEGYEDDDDTHFCMKCNLTIHGLDNYVRHRRSGCRPPDDKNETVHEPPSTPTTVSYPEFLNADAFFSSLELQSSAKSSSQRTSSALESGSRKCKKDDARKKGQKGHVDVDEAAAKDKLHSILPTVGDLDDPTDPLSIQSLVFPDIVSSSSGKTVGSTVVQDKFAQSLPQTGSNMHSAVFPVKHEPETSLACLMTDVKQNERKRQESAQRIEPDHQNSWLVEDAILVDLNLGNSENKELARYDFGYQLDNDFENDMLDDDLGDDDSYSDSDDDESRERLPRGHTGGKWKPGDLPQDMPHMHEDDVDPEDDHQEHSLPAYTGGKWKPAKTAQKVVEYESKDTSGQPPPGYTRGKWVPGARADIESGYWCNPCGRKLASRLVYNRHLLSDLHARRSIREIDGGLHLPRGTDPHAGRRVSARRRAVSFATRAKEEPEQRGARKGARRREKEVLTCEMCRARVRRPQMGKHLLSHYHCRVAGMNPCSPSARRFLLENMANVVRQCPFQCAPCRFYCNTEDTFLLHWRSDLHARTFGQMIGSCRCTPCDFWCEDRSTLESHLLSTSHRDVVSMINGSVPVVISCQRALPCGGCDRRFRYNLQLRLHARETGHVAGDTASDDYQLRIRCDMCPKIVRSLVSLQRHQLGCHVAGSEATKEDDDREMTVARPAPYFCSFCSMNFTTAQEAVLHRRTSSHKEIVKARKCRQGASGVSAARDCPHCDEKQSSLAAHKDHLLRCHADLCHRCPRCGTLFALSQDVTRHTRGGNCARKNGESNAVTGTRREWRCNDCAFSTDSQAEFIFHEALHDGATRERTTESSSNRSLPKYRCPVCKKIFTKVSLRNHIRQHTGEKPFPCAKCSLSFSRRSDLNAHQRMCCTVQSSELDKTGRRRSFVCSECTEGFYTKHALRQHTLRHAGKQYKCGLPGCPTVLRTASELKTHRTLVHDSVERRYSCPECSYAAKTKTQLRRHSTRHGDTVDDPGERHIHRCDHAGCDFQTRVSSHLRRHMRLHTGSKPYKCRHCSYASNNLENLRKHVLSTSLHPGKTIYECDFCAASDTMADPYRTNFAKELRAHLSEAHVKEFPTPDRANKYVLDIFSVIPVGAFASN